MQVILLSKSNMKEREEEGEEDGLGRERGSRRGKGKRRKLMSRKE